MPNELFITRKEMARQLGASVKTVVELIKDGTIPAYDITAGRKQNPCYRVRREDFETFLESVRTRPTKKK